MAPPTVLRVGVAASGGRDSTALLHCTVRAARALGIEVIALHVHHGLMAQADTWMAQVRGQCRRWGAGFACTRLTGAPASGESVEAWARRERYRALAAMALAASCPLVLLAHHRRDQAETWLLQALRGGGPAGLSGMPDVAQRDGLIWSRPWLAQPREAIDVYLRRHRLRHADDASNADPRFARSRLRQQVWPALQAAFADAEVVLAAAARRAQEARALADEVAALDLPQVYRGGADVPVRGHSVSLAAWQALPAARRRNAMRAWLAGELSAGVPETLLDRLDAELPHAAAGRWPAPGGELRLHRGQLSYSRDAESARPMTAREASTPSPTTLDLSVPGTVYLRAWGGHLHVTAGQSGGAPVELLRGVSLARRQGGEQFRLAPRAAARSLKKQFQSRGVAAWERDGPLLYAADGRLLFVPGLGVDGACQAAPGQPALQLGWVPDAAPQRPGGAPRRG